MTPSKKQLANLERVKAGKYYQELIDMGLQPFTEEWRRASTRLRDRDDRKNQTPEQREHALELRRQNYYKNIERERERHRERKKEKRQADKESVNDYQRSWYERNRDIAATKSRNRRYRREPNRQIRTATDLYAKGLLTHQQYLEQINECVERAKRLSREGPLRAGRKRQGASTEGSSKRSSPKRPRTSSDSPSES